MLKDYAADVVIVGAGIVGAAVAWQLIQAFPSKKILIVEKETGCAMHQTGRNSGVVHAGVYYEPGSMKASMCRQGLEDTLAFCQKRSLPINQCGKLIVATDPKEHAALHKLFERCELNDLQPSMLSQKQLQQREPMISGSQAMFIRHTAITDYQRITQCLLKEFEQLGGKVQYGANIDNGSQTPSGVELECKGHKITASLLINCAGLMSDRLAKLFGMSLDCKIVPFKGEYYKLPQSFSRSMRHLIYPVPDPALPFLGIHLTKLIDGGVIVGPNAVLAGAKEGYSKNDWSLSQLLDTARYPGFWRLMRKHHKSVFSELKNSIWRQGYLQQVQKYCPTVESHHLMEFRAGIRAQAVSINGALIHDFAFAESEHCLHVINAPSPAATSALPIAREIVRRVEERAF